MNDEFYNAAFNEAERAKIERTHVVNEDNPEYSTKGGNDTEDDVFLLSIAEVEEYFVGSGDRQLKPTKYAIANGAWTYNGNAYWWLRSPGDFRIGPRESLPLVTSSILAALSSLMLIPSAPLCGSIWENNDLGAG